MSKKYAKKNVQKLTWPEIIRKRPGMYIGRINNRGFIEIIKNILTETFTATSTKHGFIDFLGDYSARISFNNLKRPISDDWMIIDKISAPFSSYYPVLNALSTSFRLRCFDAEGKEVLHQYFEKGELQLGEIQHQEITCERFQIEFQLDESIWGEKLHWNYDYIMQELRDLAFLHRAATLHITYPYQTDTCKLIYHFPNGLNDKIASEKLKGLGGCYFDTYFAEEIDGFFLEVAFAFRDYAVDGAFLQSYVNDKCTTEHGTHVDGLLKGLTYGVMQYFQKHNLTQQYKISEKGMREHLIAAINIRIKEAVFSGCVKNKLANAEIIEPIANFVAELFFEQIEANEAATEKLIRKFQI